MKKANSNTNGDVRIGISGWRYSPWRGGFYPQGLTQKNELHFASRQVRTIEINGSFYATQSPKSYANWYEQTPEDFVFAVKCPRYITHIRRLNNIEAPMGNFYGSGVLLLREKLGPFLWQLPPSFRFDPDRLEEFFKLLPNTVADAVKLTKKADRVEPEYPDNAANSRTRLRHALEIRHHSFENPEFITLLRKYGVSLVFADTAGKWPYIEDVTADFIYIRLHGERQIYRSGYEEPSLKFWQQRISKWRSGSQMSDPLTMSDTPPPKKPRDVYIYFDNDIKVRAPFDAQKLNKMING